MKHRADLQNRSALFYYITNKKNSMSCLLKRVLTFKEPVTFKEIRVYDDAQQDITAQCMYSWSADGVCWVNWTDWKTYSSLASSLESDFYLRILLFGSFCRVALDGLTVDCYSICIYNENPFEISFCDNAALFNPYAGLDCALLMQQQMSDSIICMFGIPCYYFRVLPDEDSVDYTFKEYVLHAVSDVKIVKLMVQDGQMPSSNPQMKEFDFDWDNDWEVELGKTDFARAFGDTAFPKQRDFLYIPMMKRMYEVNSAYDEKNEGFMWRSVTWKLGLVKYADKTNVDQNEFEDLIDSFIVNKYDDVFGREREEQRRQSAADQAEEPLHAATNLYQLNMQDAVRASVTAHERQSVVARQINNGSILIAKNFYNFRDRDSVVTYQKGWCGESGALSLLFFTPQASVSAVGEDDTNIIVAIGNNTVAWSDGKIIFKDLIYKCDFDSCYLLCARWSHKNFSAELDIYKLEADPRVPKWKLRPEMYRLECVSSTTTAYDDRFFSAEKVPVSLRPWPLRVAGFKLFENEMTREEIFKEGNKYTTNNESCVLNDCVRPFEDSHGFSVR